MKNCKINTRIELTNNIAVWRVFNPISPVIFKRRRCASAAHDSTSTESGICPLVFWKDAKEIALRTQALAEIWPGEIKFSFPSPYAVSIVFSNKSWFKTGNSSLNDEPKKALKTLRVTSCSGNSHNFGEIDDWSADKKEDLRSGIPNSVPVTGWPVLVEIHLNPASDEMGIPSKYQLGPSWHSDTEVFSELLLVGEIQSFVGFKTDPGEERRPEKSVRFVSFASIESCVEAPCERTANDWNWAKVFSSCSTRRERVSRSLVFRLQGDEPY